MAVCKRNYLLLSYKYNSVHRMMCLNDSTVGTTTCRVGMQRVVAEVTRLMEQQHCSHQYLEKLRSENEAIASDEKNRQVYKYNVHCLHQGL